MKINERHYKNEISAFVDHELDSDARHAIGEHLLVCADCRQLHDQVRLGARLASRLGQSDAPRGLWSRINAELDGPRERARFPIFTPDFAAAAIIVLIAGIGIFLFLKDRPTDVAVTRPDGWNIERLSGDLSLGDRDVIGVGETIETRDGERVRLQVPEIGNVEVAPNSTVKLVASGSNEHRLALDRGRLSAKILAPPRLFVVDTPSAVAVDLGCAYTLDVAENGDAHLHVTSGYVALERAGRDVIVPAGAIAITKKDGGLGTPFADDSAETFRAMLYRFDFEGGKELGKLISAAGKKDSVTMWHLLRTVPERERAMVLDRLLKFVKMPAGATRSGLLALEKPMLDELWIEVKTVWYAT